MAIVEKITSSFAILDVKEGRQEVFRHFAKMPIGVYPAPHLRIPVTITGFIDGINSDDDGESREFTIDVSSVGVGHGEVAP